MLQRFCLMIWCCFLLSGCWVQQHTTTFNTDGSGVNEINIGFSRDFLSFAGLAGSGGNDLETVLAGFEGLVDTLPVEWNVSSAPWESVDGSYKGTSLRMEFSDPAMLEDQLSQAFLSEGNSLIAFEDVSVREEDGEWIIQARIISAFEDAGLSTEFEELGAGMDAFTTLGMEPPLAVWQIEFPNGINEWSEPDIALQEGNRVTYTFPFPQDQTYDIVVRGNVSSVWLPPTALLIGALAGTGVLLILLGFVLLRRQQPAQTNYYPQPAGFPPMYATRPTADSQAPDTRPLDPAEVPELPAQAAEYTPVQPAGRSMPTRSLSEYQPPYNDPWHDQHDRQ